MGGFDPNMIVGDPTEMLAKEMEELISSSIEDFEAELYRRDPMKLFYKEQCFLLTYVGLISEDKKYNERIQTQVGATWGFGGVSLDPSSPKRLSDGTLTSLKKSSAVSCAF